ncbi:MAG: hypothetical protein ACJ76I_09110 [Gaiellaceae bacterium]
MGPRRRYRDETWRLACTGDARALDRVADALVQDEPDDSSYDAHRARAFALAIERRLEEALTQLNDGSTDDWPFPAAYAADVARVRYLAGDYDGALGALRLAVHGADRLDPALADLAVLVVAGAPELRLRAVRVVLGGGTAWQRLRNAVVTGVARADRDVSGGAMTGV